MSKELTTQQGLFVLLDGRRYPVSSLEDASANYTGAIRSAGLGASQLTRKQTSPLIVDGDNRIIGYIAYNGKVFPGKPQDWRMGLEPLFNPYAGLPPMSLPAKRKAVKRKSGEKRSSSSRVVGGVR